MGGAQPKELSIYRFATVDPFKGLTDTLQLQYIRTYLSDLSAQTVIEELQYFDRDYLSEFSAFYSTSAHGYKNTCKRLHFFSDSFSRKVFENATAGIESSKKRLENSYLGFVVVRPIPAAPLGRTVLKLYPERSPKTPRITEPARNYNSHIAGLTLSVKGLAWQQQDTGVGACATVGLWTMLHSSAFDPRHSVPTTTNITISAHKRAGLGKRLFPSRGLTLQQICEAIKDQGLAPALTDGNVRSPDKSTVNGFARERFASSIAAYIRSGYPVLLMGKRGQGGHAICVVGFRSCTQPPLSSNEVGIEDGAVEVIYIHDDNIGPNVRFEVVDKTLPKTGEKIVGLKPVAPMPTASHPPYKRVKFSPEPFIPQHILVATHEDLRTSPDEMHKAGLKTVQQMAFVLKGISNLTKKQLPGLTFSTRFIRLSDYLGSELDRTLKGSGKILSKVRLALVEKVSPMSLFVGVIRVATENSTPLVDILYDTTDSDRNHPVFAHVAYSPMAQYVLKVVTASDGEDFGVSVPAF